MKSIDTARSIELLDSLQSVVASSLTDIAGRFSDLLHPLIGHSALIMCTGNRAGRTQKGAGDRAIIEGVTRAELDAVRLGLDTAEADPWGRRAVIGGTDRPIIAWIAPTGALLVLTDPGLTARGAADPEATLALVGRLWQLVARSIRQQLDAAAPDSFPDSRTDSAERARLIADLTDAHSATLESVLAVLRSDSVTADAARQQAIDLAANALVRMRAVSAGDRPPAGEAAARATKRLPADLRPFGSADEPGMQPAPLGRAAEWGLSPREQGVMALVATGARNKAIAAELLISENTVKFHVANLLRKVGASTRAELAALAR